MAYQSSVQEPYCLTEAGLAQSQFPNAAIAGSSNFAARTRLWSYLSTADALTTVTASSYFSDGYNRGMRPGDLVMITNSTSSGSSTGVTITFAVVTAFSTATGGVNLTTGNVLN